MRLWSKKPTSGYLQVHEAGERPPEKRRPLIDGSFGTSSRMVPSLSDKIQHSISDLSPSGSGTSEKDRSAVLRFLNKLVLVPGGQENRHLKWFVEIWDVIIFLVVTMVAYYEPYVVVLYTPVTETFFMKLWNIVLNGMFTTDMVAQFFISVPHSEDSHHKHLWETNVVNIARHYCGRPFSDQGRAGWFWMDLLIVIVGWSSVSFERCRHFRPLLAFRLLRVFHSSRMQRLTRLSEVLHSLYGFPLAVVEMGKFLLVTTLASHWTACLWIAVEGRKTSGFISYTAPSGETWLTALIDSKGDTCEPDASNDPLCVYILATYWSVMTLTSVGYGDIVPQNKMEYVVCIITMFVLGYVWAFVVGVIVSILQNMDPFTAEYKHTLDELGNLMKRRGLPGKIQVGVRTYLHETAQFQRLNRQRDLVERYLSSGLQRELAANSAEVGRLRECVYWMRDLQEEAVLDVVRALQPQAYGRDEIINMPSRMIIIQKGLAGVRGKLLSRGHVYGENNILIESPRLMDSVMPRTINFLQLMMLDKESLVTVAKSYPEADKRLRRAQIRTAVMRAFVLAATKEKLRKARGLIRSSNTEWLSGHCSNGRRASGRKDEVDGSFVNLGKRDTGDDDNNNSNAQQNQMDVLRGMLERMLHRQEEMQVRVEEVQEEVRHVTEQNEALRHAGQHKSWFRPLATHR